MSRTALVAAVVSAVCLAAGFLLVGGQDETLIAPGVLFFAASLGAAAVAIGSRAYGPDVEGALDLSTRIGMGLLGGVLAGLVHGVLTWIAAPIAGSLLAGGLDTGLGVEGWRMRLVLGGLWGLAFGLFYFGIPGRDFVRRGVAFSVLPTLVTLLYVYPVYLGAGLLGLRLGPLGWAFIALGYTISGVVASAVIAWASRTDLAPISRPLVD